MKKTKFYENRSFKIVVSLVFGIALVTFLFYGLSNDLFPTSIAWKTAESKNNYFTIKYPRRWYGPSPRDSNLITQYPFSQFFVSEVTNTESEDGVGRDEAIEKVEEPKKSTLSVYGLYYTLDSGQTETFAAFDRLAEAEIEEKVSVNEIFDQEYTVTKLGETVIDNEKAYLSEIKSKNPEAERVYSVTARVKKYGVIWDFTFDYDYGVPPSQPAEEAIRENMKTFTMMLHTVRLQKPSWIK